MHTHTHTHTHTQPFYGSLDFVRDNPSELVPEETFTHSHPSWSSVIPYLLHPYPVIHGILPVQFMCLTVFFHNLSKFSLVYLLAWHPRLHTPYISSINNCLPFAAHAHTITSCFAVVPRLCHLILVCLSTLYLELLPCSVMLHIHPTIFISALWSATSFSFLMGQVSLPCNILLHTQLLYNIPHTINDKSLLVSNGTICLNLFHPIRILVSTAVSAIQHLSLHSACHLNNKPYPLTPDLHWHQHLHLCIRNRLLDSRNLYKQMSLSLCTCYPLYHYTFGIRKLESLVLLPWFYINCFEAILVCDSQMDKWTHDSIYHATIMLCIKITINSPEQNPMECHGWDTMLERSY